MASIRQQDRALRLAANGYSVRQILEETGLTRDELEVLVHAFPSLERAGCRKPKCGQPPVSAGRYPTGWIRLQTTPNPQPVWFCSWPCVLRYATGRDRAAAAAG